MSTDVPFDAFTMDDLDADKPGQGGGGRLPEGGYCVQIIDVILQNERGSCEIKTEVLEAKEEGMRGRHHTEYLKWPKPSYTETGNRIAKEQLVAWCYAAKTTSPEIIKQRQQARQGFDANWLASMVGQVVLIYLKEDPYIDETTGQEKKPTKAEGRVWALDNPKGSGIPGYAGPQNTASTSGTPGTTGTATQPATVASVAPATPAAADPFAGLL